MTDRRLTTTVEISDQIELQLSTSHYPDRKQYLTSLSRAEIDGIFRTLSIMEDVEFVHHESTARYSAKKLAEIHEQQKHLLGDPDWLNWAAEKKLSN